MRVSTRGVRLAVCAAIIMTWPALGRAAETQAAGDLVEFASQEGRFRALLPGKPKYEKTTVGDAKEEQHQFSIGGAEGVYLISYQENPNLAGASREIQAAALVSGRDHLVKVFAGKLIESEEIELDETYPGLAFRLTIPAAQGEGRCRFYLASGRLYQVLVIGTPAFVQADEATRVLESFVLVAEDEAASPGG